MKATTEAVASDIQTSNMEEYKNFKFIGETGEVDSITGGYSARFEKGKVYIGRYAYAGGAIDIRGIGGLYDTVLFEETDLISLSYYRLKIGKKETTVNTTDNDCISITPFTKVEGYIDIGWLIICSVDGKAVKPNTKTLAIDYEKVGESDNKAVPLMKKGEDYVYLGNLRVIVAMENGNSYRLRYGDVLNHGEVKGDKVLFDAVNCMPTEGVCAVPKENCEKAAVFTSIGENIAENLKESNELFKDNTITILGKLVKLQQELINKLL